MARSIVVSVVLGSTLGCASGGTHEHHGHGMPHRFEDAERWAREFDDPGRDAWQEPERIVARVATRRDMTIVDLGAGTGYFTVRFARAVPDGEVVAVDIEPTLVRHIDARAAKEGLTNVRTWLAAPADPDLADWRGRVDVAFMCNTYHHLADRPAYFARVAHALRRDGRVVIVDFRPSSTKGPPRELKVSIEQVVNEMSEAGLVLIGRDDALPDQYLLEFQKN